MILLRLIAALVLTVATAAAQNVLVTGSVSDASTREPIVGATVRVLDGSRGTYTARNGAFRLPLPRGSHRLVVSSIGFTSDTVQVSTGSGPVEIALRSSPVQLNEVAVSAEHSADDVVRNAILRKKENLERLRTFSGVLYSKLSMNIEGNAFGAIGDEDRATIMETFSRYYYDRDRTPPIHIDVVNRRQTANIPSEGNLFALGNFVSFYDDELPLLNARVMTPLSSEAFSRYRFEFEGRTKIDDQAVYIIRVIPTTRVLPAMSGTMKIIKGTYNLIEVDLKPTEATAIAFVRDLRFVQRFERLAKDVWYPTYLEITGAATVEIVKGLAEIQATVKATSIVSEATVNEPIADSIFAATDEDGRASIISAAADADSARAEFWENNALSELSSEERETYARIDSIVAEADTSARQSERGISFGVMPMIDYNRVGGVTLLANANVGFGSLLRLGAGGGYSFGMRRPVGELNAAITPFDGEVVSISVSASVFSRLASNHWDRAIPRIVNTVTSALFHRDYYDWYRQDGWSAGIAAEMFGLMSTAGVDASRHFAHRETQKRSIFVDDWFRVNPPVVDGNYRVFNASLAYGQADNTISISSGADADFGIKVSGITGEESSAGSRFDAVEAKLIAELPTFGTGYVPMLMRIAVHAGTGTALPLEYQFRMRTAASIVAPFGHFTSAPIGRYGGERYVAAHAEHNFSDIIWRWIGLPSYWGRGVEFIIAGSAAHYEFHGAPDTRRIMRYGLEDTGGEWYAEAVFGLGKIPTFISNVIFLRADARFGIGPLARGNWGVTLGISSPF